MSEYSCQDEPPNKAARIIQDSLPDAEVDAGVSKLPPSRGLQVQIIEFKALPEFNGKIGCLQDFDPQQGRWSVMLVGSTVTKLVRPHNLQLLMGSVSCDAGSDCEELESLDVASLEAELPVVQKQLMCKKLHPHVSKRVGDTADASAIARILLELIEMNVSQLSKLLASESGFLSKVDDLWLKFACLGDVREHLDPKTVGLKSLAIVATRQDPDAPELLRFIMSKRKLDINGRLKQSLNQTPLFYAAKYGSTDVVSSFLQIKAEIDARDNYEQTPLFYAAKYKAANVSILLEGRADPNACDRSRRTPLHFSWHGVAVRELVAARADANLADRKGHTALTHMCNPQSTDWPDKSVTQALLELSTDEDTARLFMKFAK